MMYMLGILERQHDYCEWEHIMARAVGNITLHELISNSPIGLSNFAIFHHLCFMWREGKLFHGVHRPARA